MPKHSLTRRTFLEKAAMTATLTLSGCAAVNKTAKATKGKLHLACNQYPWIVYYQRDNRDFTKMLDEGLAEMASCSIDGFEPIINAPDDIDRLAPLLNKHGLEMRSFYVNSSLHEAAQADESVEQIVAIATKAKSVDVKIIVTNPSPIRWGGEESKTDQQLRTQAQAMDSLGALLRSMGLTLAYHNHDIELRNAAREFHHMMAGTDPRNVTLCLDAHWVYRGAGNSAVALFDVLELYGKRISELHLRQSINNTWSETFGEGDIDYPALAEHLLRIRVKPHLVLEQAVENGTPKTISTVEAFRRSSEYARTVFAVFTA